MKHRTLIIGEVGQAHEGSLGMAHSYIDALCAAGVDAIKFQIHIAEAESSSSEKFRVKFSYEDETRFDYWKRMEFTEEQWNGLKNHCRDKGVVFIPSPFSCAAVELLERLGVETYKIASGEITNYLMLEKIAKTGKGIILSSGMNSLGDIDACIQLLKRFGNELSILQCTTAYPTQPEEIGINVIDVFKQRYKIPCGLSDHSGTIYPPLAAVASGAEIIEVHAVFDKRMFGPDVKASLTIDEITTMVSGIRYIERMLSNTVDKTDLDRFSDLREMFGKSIAVNKDLNIGDVISSDDLESKKPAGEGIPAREYQTVLGKPIKNAKKKWDFLKREDF